MAGHSHWAGIKHKKGKADKERSKIFSKLSKEITVAAKLGDKDPALNSRLRSAVQAARSANMPKDNISRAIDKSSISNQSNFENLRYEGFGPEKVAVIVETLTDNKNRTVSEVRHAFSKFGGNLGTSGSVAYLFENKGKLFVKADTSNEAFFDQVIESGADDISDLDGGMVEVVCDPKILSNVKVALENHGIQIEATEVIMEAENNIPLDLEHSEKNIKLVELLEELDDVQEVFTNAKLDESIY